MDGNHTVVLIQEAKSSCRGKWYLPAGKIKLGEDVFECAKRETLEESGLVIENTKIFHSEFCKISQDLDLIKYHLTATIAGGSLKTIKQMDEESMQAKWFKICDLKKLDLRGDDIIEEIDQCLHFRLKEKVFQNYLERNQKLKVLQQK
ncbi:mutt/nudix hydrolase [Anaeramoeba flamelloides]|uniref:Mutt/nudix hydrolase n=1 Tax=Anaeramoeba flamelloides TaxID=1746091 RepID=A0AAV8A5Q8_9EUKA|nr:mutt/nudix hydrolase [Anaeramoeba flamelloides]KAJ6253613.1 mutt/nudix hydrolase [Anaeramoeba flamelloides]